MKDRLLSFVYDSVDVTSCRFWNELDLKKLDEQVPELGQSVYSALGTKIWLAAVLVLRKEQTNLHTDHTLGQRGQKARLNLPLLNCEKSQTVFYDAGDQPPVAINAFDNTKVWRWGSNFPVLTRVVLSEPTILRVSALHGVHSFTTAPRIALTLNLERDAAEFLDEP